MAIESARQASLTGERDFHFTDRDFKYIKDLVRDTSGIVLSEIKRDMVYGRLSRRLRQLGLDRFSDYCEILKSGDSDELRSFTNALTTNLTAFFRENHHFEFIHDLLAQRRNIAGKNRIRIWSAGCSTGEEPYSIAMMVREALGNCTGLDVKILATDLDTNVLSHGERGVYDVERVASMPQERVERWFKRGKGKNDGYVMVAPELRELITFKQLNLMHPWPMRGPFDLIFCRNVVIYFDKPTQKILFDRFADILSDTGHLFLGHSETMFKVSTRFDLVGKTIYVRNSSNTNPEARGE